MKNDKRQIDPLEELMLELDQADRAGLFRRSPVDVSRLVQTQPAAPGWSKWTSRVLPAAAAVALAVGVGAWMFQNELAKIRGRQLPGTLAIASPTELGRFHSCFSGPRNSLDRECVEQDFDSDGDVDLADFSAYQLAFASMTH